MIVELRQAELIIGSGMFFFLRVRIPMWFASGPLFERERVLADSGQRAVRMKVLWKVNL